MSKLENDVIEDAVWNKVGMTNGMRYEPERVWKNVTAHLALKWASINDQQTHEKQTESEAWLDESKQKKRYEVESHHAATNREVLQRHGAFAFGSKFDILHVCIHGMIDSSNGA